MIKQDTLSSRQLIVLIILFLFGSNVIIGVNIASSVGQDSWICFIFSFILNIPFVLIFSKIVTVFTKKNIYEICDQLFGRIIGKIITIIFILHTLYLGSIVLRNFSEYIEITTLPETPQLPIMICIILIVIYLVKSGIKVVGRWGPIILATIILTVGFTILLSVPIMDFDNLKPYFEHKIIKMGDSAFKSFLLPFSELTIFLGMADCFDLKNKQKKTYLASILIGGLVLLLIILRNILVLGVPLLKNTSFASYEAARIISVGEFFTRIEGLITINFVLAGITRIAIFVIVLSKGLSHISKNSDYKNLIIPSSLLMLGICPFLYKNVLDMFDFVPVFGFYSIPIHVFLPILILLFIKIKHKDKIKNFL